MSKFDLNNPLDFARLTLSDAGALLNAFMPGVDPSDWNILEGSYNGVLFHVFVSKSDYQAALSNIQDSGGRRKVRYAFPYRDGQTTDDLGRKAESYSMDILIHGLRYQSGLSSLMREFNKPTPGTLIHPVRGKLTVAVDDFSIQHSSESRNAAILKVVFIEHNFTIGSFRELKDKTVKSALAKTLEAFGIIENAILQVQGQIKFAQSLKNQIVAALNEYNAGYAKTVSAINVSFNSRGSADIPTLLPVNDGGTLNPNGTLSTDTFPIAGPLSSTPSSVSQVSQPKSASELTSELNARRAEARAIMDAMLGQGANSLQMHNSVVGMRETLVLLQDALEAGIASSQSQVIQYVTPRVMSVREIAFANGIGVSRFAEIIILNPDLESINFVPKDRSLKVPIS